MTFASAITRWFFKQPQGFVRGRRVEWPIRNRKFVHSRVVSRLHWDRLDEEAMRDSEVAHFFRIIICQHHMAHCGFE